MNIRQLLLLVSLVFLVTAFAHAQDPVQAAPGKYKLLFENERIRMLEVQIPPGETVPTHSHPDHAAYAATPCTLTITGSDGKAQQVSMKEGEAMWLEADTHSAVNNGSTACRIAVFELKEASLKK